jgi:hypothetical protein
MLAFAGLANLVSHAWWLRVLVMIGTLVVSMLVLTRYGSHSGV